MRLDYAQGCVSPAPAWLLLKTQEKGQQSMSLLTYLSPRNILSVLHVILGVLVFVCGIMSASTDSASCGEQWIYLTITLLYVSFYLLPSSSFSILFIIANIQLIYFISLISLFMIAAQMYGHPYFAQAGILIFLHLPSYNII